jgi:tRNA(Ile)-lysidine synthase
MNAVPRSHPPTLITLARAAIRGQNLVARGATVLVAVSGGPDSMALLHVLSLLRRELAFGLFAHGVDHGLRAEAPAELDLAESFARAVDVPFRRTLVCVSTGGNLQARARNARWDALKDAAARVGANRIATGHHADDRAETLLMRMLRGTRAQGLGVLPACDGDRIRPFWRARRWDVEAHVRRHRIPHCLDPSNQDPRFLRARVRSDLIPALERLNPRVVEHMCALADELGALNAACTRDVSPSGPIDAEVASVANLKTGGPQARQHKTGGPKGPTAQNRRAKRPDSTRQ